MRIGKLVAAFALAGACGPGALYISDDAPPPPREEIVTYQPRAFWVHGHWEREAHHWVWRGGHYERERPGYAYKEGRWEHNEGRYEWVEGGWRPRGG